MLGFSMVMGKCSGMDSLRNPTDIERLITVKGIVIRCSDLTPETWTSKKWSILCGILEDDMCFFHVFSMFSVCIHVVTLNC